MDEADIHRAHFLDVAPLQCVQPQHLGKALLCRLLAHEQAGGIVAAGLRLADTAFHRPAKAVRHIDRHRVEPLLEVGSYRASHNEMQVGSRRPEAQFGGGRNHGGADVERRTRLVGHPGLVDFDQLPYGFDMERLVHGWHDQALGRPVEPAHVLVGPKQVDTAIGPAVSLQALKNLLPVVQHRGRRVQGEIVERFYCLAVPALTLVIALGKQVIGEDVAKAQLRRTLTPLISVQGFYTDFHAPSCSVSWKFIHSEY